jgi:hypothetical protein
MKISPDTRVLIRSKIKEYEELLEEIGVTYSNVPESSKGNLVVLNRIRRKDIEEFIEFLRNLLAL